MLLKHLIGIHRGNQNHDDPVALHLGFPDRFQDLSKLLHVLMRLIKHRHQISEILRDVFHCVQYICICMCKQASQSLLTMLHLNCEVQLIIKTRQIMTLPQCFQTTIYCKNCR